MLQERALSISIPNLNERATNEHGHNACPLQQPVARLLAKREAFITQYYKLEDNVKVAAV